MTTYAIPLIGVITLVSCANPPPQPGTSVAQGRIRLIISCAHASLK